MPLKKSLSLLILFCLCLSAPQFAIAQTNIRITAQGYHAALTAKSYARHNIKANWGIFSYFLVAANWAEAYAGGYVSPMPWLEIGLGVGFEQFPSNPYRVASIVWLGNPKVSMLNIFEYGGSGSWFQNILKYRATERLHIGLRTERFVGIGPYLEYSLSHFIFWGTPAYDWVTEQMGLLIGLDLLY